MKNLDFEWLTDKFMLYCHDAQPSKRACISNYLDRVSKHIASNYIRSLVFSIAFDIIPLLSSRGDSFHEKR